MKIRNILVGLTLLSVIPLYGQELASFYNQGNQAYIDGDYRKAINNYQEAVSMGARDADLFFNLGNAYFKVGDVGNSILNYLRAWYLKPQASDVEFNLAFARAVRKDDIKSIYSGFLFRIYREIIFLFSSARLVFIISLLSLILTIFVALYIVKKLPSFKTVSIILGVVLVVFAIIFVLKLTDDWFTNRAVVVNLEQKVYSAPYEDSELLFVIHSGTEVVELERRLEWSNIKLEDGKEGWVKSEGIEKVLLE